MRSLTRIVPLIAAAAFLAAVNPAPVMRPGLAQVTCNDGPAAGLWILPTAPGGIGLVHGRLIDSATSQTTHRIRLLLTDVPSPCLSCIQGEVSGFLYPGSGSAPAYEVRGEYGGSFFSGAGKCQLRIFRVGGGPAVGFLEGRFDDLPGDGMPGTFDGHWQICQ